MRSPIPHDWAVPSRFRARMGERAGRQRHMAEDGHLLLILHEVPKRREDQRAARLFWRAPDGSWKSTGLGSGPQALRTHLKGFEDAADALEKRLDGAERAEDYHEVLSEAGPLCRSARNMHAALQSAREAVDDREIIAARDRAAELERAFELILAEAKNGLDYTVARRSEEHAEASRRIAEAGHRLNLIAAVFLPVTAVSGVFGMTLSHGLEHWHAPYAFWAVALFGFGLGFLMKSALAKKP